MGNIVTEMVTWGTSAVFSELELITIEICILYSCTFFNDDAYIRTYYIIEFYQLRALNCTLYIIRRYIHTVHILYMLELAIDTDSFSTQITTTVQQHN